MEEPSVQLCFRHHRAGGIMALTCAYCFLLAPSVELLLSMQITSATSRGTNLSPRPLQGVQGPGSDPWVPPSSLPPRVKSVCLLWIHEAFRGSGSFSPTLLQLCFFHSTEFTQLLLLFFFFLVDTVFLVQVWKVLSEDSYPVGAPSGWDGPERLSCLQEKKNHNQITAEKTFQILMCNYSVKQQNTSSASFLEALCFGPREICLPEELRESVPGWAGGVGPGGKLMDLISRAGLFFHDFQSPSVSGVICWHWRLL